MRLFIDSAEPRNWEAGMRRGWVYGVTTNPLVLQREGRTVKPETYRALADEARALGLAEIHIQATGAKSAEIAESARFIAGLWDGVVVKIPLSEAGLTAAAALSAEKVPMTLTAAYAAHQMIPALAIGVSYVAPYYGRMLDAGRDPDAVLARMKAMRDRSDSTTRILIASLRSIEQMEHLAALGHDTFTLAPKLAASLGIDDLTEAAAAEFERAARDGPNPPEARRRQ
ncbi:MAG: transaldolase [Rhodospirillales bacterium]|nr:transaldolase [Rhodospirillales bacterium]